MRDYLREIDLNPPGATPINSPRDARGHSDFCFLSDGQELVLVPQQQSAALPFRVLVSFDCDHQELLNQPVPPPGLAFGPRVHGILAFDPAFPMNVRNVLRRECCHQRRGVRVWLDPNGPQPPAGQPIVVQVSAWAKDGPCC